MMLKKWNEKKRNEFEIEIRFLDFFFLFFFRIETILSKAKGSDGYAM